jgi:TPR repeat protein
MSAIKYASKQDQDELSALTLKYESGSVLSADEGFGLIELCDQLISRTRALQVAADLAEKRNGGAAFAVTVCIYGDKRRNSGPDGDQWLRWSLISASIEHEFQGESEFWIGEWHYVGEEYADAETWLKRASNHGVMWADLALGFLYEDGLLGQPDYIGAATHFMRFGLIRKRLLAAGQDKDGDGQALADCSYDDSDEPCSPIDDGGDWNDLDRLRLYLRSTPSEKRCVLLRIFDIEA